MAIVLIAAAVPTIAAGFAQSFTFILIMRFIQGLLLGGLAVYLRSLNRKQTCTRGVSAGA